MVLHVPYTLNQTSRRSWRPSPPSPRYTSHWGVVTSSGLSAHTLIWLAAIVSLDVTGRELLPWSDWPRARTLICLVERAYLDLIGRKLILDLIDQELIPWSDWPRAHAFIWLVWAYTLFWFLAYTLIWLDETSSSRALIGRAIYSFPTNRTCVDTGSVFSGLVSYPYPWRQLLNYKPSTILLET
jgi:hypothetical protein